MLPVSMYDIIIVSSVPTIRHDMVLNKETLWLFLLILVFPDLNKSTII